MSNLIHDCDVIVIGAGVAGLAAATMLARSGKRVVVVEKHSTAGGRARQFEKDGFVFDMGPSWYWMPDVFEDFFTAAGSRIADHLDLVRLDPSYRVWFEHEKLDVPAGTPNVRSLFEELEPGSSSQFDAFLEQARHRYEVGMREFVWKAGHSAMEFVSPAALRDAFRLSVFGSLSRHIRAHFKDERIVQLLEFPVLFLGTSAQSAPSLYSLMNYADIALGTWYPIGGMFKIIEGMMSVATQAGVTFQFDSEVDSIVEEDGRVAGVRVGNGILRADAVVAAADYHHVEQQLLPATWRRYDQAYWDKRKMSPSALVFYIGVNRRLPGLEHHNLFFDVPFEPHADAIYKHPRWPRQPLFYVAAPSRTDPSVAPEDCENLFVLMPVASGLHEREGVRDEMFETIMSRLEQRLGVDIRQSIVYRRDYAHAEFEADYGAFRGNAYGLANTLGQTAFLKPKLRSRLPGLFFAGQLTTPGPGLPPCLISGQIAAREASQWLARNSSQTVGAVA